MIVVECIVKKILYNYTAKKKKRKKTEYDVKRQWNVLKIYLKIMLHLFAAAKRTQMHASIVFVKSYNMDAHSS